jgi:hypothetical protein
LLLLLASLLLFASLLLLASLLLFGVTVVAGVIVVIGFPSFNKTCLLLQPSVIFVFCYCCRSCSFQAFAAIGVPGVLLFSFLLLTVFNQTFVDTYAEDPFLLAFLLMMTSLLLLS